MNAEVERAQSQLNFAALNAAIRATNFAILESVQAQRSVALAALAGQQGKPDEMLNLFQQAIGELSKVLAAARESNALLDRMNDAGE